MFWNLTEVTEYDRMVMAQMHVCRGLAGIMEACQEPLAREAEQHCLSATHLGRLVSSNKCAAAWAKTYTMEGAQETFRGVAEVTEQLHEECGKFEGQVCFALFARVLCICFSGLFFTSSARYC